MRGQWTPDRKATTTLAVPRSVVGSSSIVDTHPGTNRHCAGSGILTCDRSVVHLVPQLAPFDTLRQKFDFGIGSALSGIKFHAVRSDSRSRNIPGTIEITRRLLKHLHQMCDHIIGHTFEMLLTYHCMVYNVDGRTQHSLAQRSCHDTSFQLRSSTIQTKHITTRNVRHQLGRLSP